MASFLSARNTRDGRLRRIARGARAPAARGLLARSATPSPSRFVVGCRYLCRRDHRRRQHGGGRGVLRRGVRAGGHGLPVAVARRQVRGRASSRRSAGRLSLHRAPAAGSACRRCSPTRQGRSGATSRRRPAFGGAVRDGRLRHADRRGRRHPYLRSRRRAILASGAADIIAAARQSLADPDWFLKMRTGARRRGPAVLLHQLLRGARPDAQAGHVQAVGPRERSTSPASRRSADGRRRLVAPQWRAPAAMRITILGGGPAGLYFALLMKRRDPAHAVTVIERDGPDDTFGWGIVFSDQTFDYLRDSDEPSFEAITAGLRPVGQRRHRPSRRADHGPRQPVLGDRAHPLPARCCRRAAASSASTSSSTAAVDDLAALPPHDLLVGADGANSLVRRTHERSLSAHRRVRTQQVHLAGHAAAVPRPDADVRRSTPPASTRRIPTSSTTAPAPSSSNAARRHGGGRTRRDGGGRDLRVPRRTCSPRRSQGEPLLTQELRQVAELPAGPKRPLVRRPDRAARRRAPHRALLYRLGHQARARGCDRAGRAPFEEADDPAGGAADVRGGSPPARGTVAAGGDSRACAGSRTWRDHMHLDPLPFAVEAMTRSKRVDLEKLRQRDPEFVARVLTRRIDDDQRPSTGIRRTRRSRARSCARCSSLKLKRLCEWAYAKSAFHRRRWEAAGFHPDQLRTLDDIRRIPFMTRAEWMDAQAEDAALRPAAGGPARAYAIRYHTTSGTTGRTPLRVLDGTKDWEWIAEMWCYGLWGFGPAADGRRLVRVLLRDLHRVLGCALCLREDRLPGALHRQRHDRVARQEHRRPGRDHGLLDADLCACGCGRRRPRWASTCRATARSTR